MATNKARGLGRGLDALFENAPANKTRDEKKSKNEKEIDSENIIKYISIDKIKQSRPPQRE